MDLASFKLRYPQFTDDTAVQVALSDAGVLIKSYNIDEGKRDLALAYLTAHILTLEQGATESKVKKVKADTVEVEFSDKSNDTDWLDLTSYGKLLKVLTIESEPKTKGYGIVKDCDKGAITFDRRDLYDRQICNKGGW